MLDFTHFLKHNESWKGKLEQKEGRALASFHLVPSIIMTFCKESLSTKNVFELEPLRELVQSPFARI